MRGEQINRSPKGHPGFVIDVPIALATINLPGKGRKIVSVEKRHISIFPSVRPNARDNVARIRKSFTHIAIHQPSLERLPTIIAATTTCDLFCIAIRPKRERIDINAKWLTNIGEKISALLLADFNADGRPEICVGTKAGNVHIFNADGARIGWCHITDPPITVLATFNGKLIAAADGVWLVTVNAKHAGG